MNRMKFKLLFTSKSNNSCKCGSQIYKNMNRLDVINCCLLSWLDSEVTSKLQLLKSLSHYEYLEEEE